MCEGSRDSSSSHAPFLKVIEGLLFSTSKPLSFKQIAAVLQIEERISSAKVKECIAALKERYIEEDRAYRLEESAGGYLLKSCPTLSPYLQALHGEERKERLSHAATETLAIIAYRQPITRPQLEEIRGVDSSGVVASLLERNLIETAGKLEVPGRPTLYRVTQQFLAHYGLNSIEELPAPYSSVEVGAVASSSCDKALF